MALALHRPSPFGGAAFTYFNIGEINENRMAGCATIILHGFLDATARHANASFIRETVFLDATVWTTDATIQQVYGLIKSLPDYTDASDV